LVGDSLNGSFLVGPEHEPGSDEERKIRLDYYIGSLALAASDELVQAVIGLRSAASNLNPPELGTAASRRIAEEEFAQAIKEIICIWIHQEAVDQDVEGMASWLRTFFRLAFGAADYYIHKPTAWEVMHAYGRCHDMVSLCMEACCRVCAELGFGSASPRLGPAVLPVILHSRPLRQGILRRALTLPLDSLEADAQLVGS